MEDDVVGVGSGDNNEAAVGAEAWIVNDMVLAFCLVLVGYDRSRILTRLDEKMTCQKFLWSKSCVVCLYGLVAFFGENNLQCGGYPKRPIWRMNEFVWRVGGGRWLLTSDERM